MNSTELTRAHLEELLRADVFQRSAKLSRLLTRLAEPALAGQAHAIKEQILGIDVFDRPTDWDPQTDSIVRVHVNRLRQTLSVYYASQNSPIRFEIPKGSYRVRCTLPSLQTEHRGSRQAISESMDAASYGTRESRHSAPIRQVQLKRLTYERGDLTNAAFCPDGESVIYSARWRGEPATMYSQRIGQRHSRSLGLPPGKLRDISATGRLLFTMGESTTGMLAQAELSGGPWREIVEGVSDAVWLPDNKNIAAVRLVDGSMRIELPLGNPIHYVAANQTDIRLKVNETGERLALIDSSLGRVDFSVLESTGQVQRISKGWRLAGGVLWLSKDRLLLSGARRGASAIYSVDLQGAEDAIYRTPITWNLYDRSSNGRVLASCVDSRLHVAFRSSSMKCEAHMPRLVNTRLVGLTPDAKFAVLMDLLSHDANRNSPILLVALPDGEPVQIAEGYYPQISPDGKAVICLERSQSEAAIVVTPIPSGLPRRYPLHATQQCHSAEFTAVAHHFLIHLFDDGGTLHTHIFEAESGALSAIPGKRFVTHIAPNQKWGVVPGGSQLRLAHLESGEIRNICCLRTGWSPVRWSNSGNEVFVFEPGNDFATGNMSRVNIGTGECQPWLTISPTDNDGVYLLNWLDITSDGRSYAYTYQQDLSDLYLLDGIAVGDVLPGP